MRRHIFILFIALMAVAAGCSSGSIPVLKQGSDSGEIIGKARGEACGHFIFSLPLYGLNFIPIKHNSRLERAIQNAVLDVPGARTLRNISIEETWQFWFIGSTRCVIVKGEAVK